MRTVALAEAASAGVAPPWARRTEALTPARERARRRLVTIVLIVYLLLIFEGSLRKWAVPELGFYIFFIRDPFVLYAYVLAVKHRLWPKRSAWLTVFVAMAVLGLVLGTIQLIARGAGATESLLAIYGWRSYFFYPPLALLIGAQFAIGDLQRVARWTLLLTVPVGALVALQFFSPPGAPINVGTADDSALQFVGLGLTGDRTRPMGTFSSGAGQNQFVASAFALLLASLMAAPGSRGVRRWVLLLAAGGIATCLAFGGSRGAVLHCALIAALGMGLGTLGKSGAAKLRALALPLSLATVFAVLYPVVFREGFEAFSMRWQAAAQAEQSVGGVVGRAFYDFVDFSRLLGTTPVLGVGLGMGGNAAATLAVRAEGQRTAGALAETDWARHVVDLGPAFGVGYIVLRIALTAWLALVVLKAARRGVSPLPLTLFGYVSHLLLIGQMTGQGAINGYAWLFVGFTLAAAAARAAPPVPSRSRRARFAARAASPS
jgi:hypothetical protein